jgi:PEP-CTERM motif
VRFACLCVLLCCSAGAAHATAVTSAYIFSAFSSPGSPTATPFTFTGLGKYGYQLNFGPGSPVATSVSHLGSGNNVVERIQKPLTFHSKSGTINANEGSSAASATRVNKEIAKLDDVGFVPDGVPDAALNVDFTNGSWVLFNSPGTTQRPLSNLMIAEDAGLDPFKLTYVKNGVSTVLFDGFSSYAANTLLNTGYFQTEDSVTPGSVLKVDQVFLFEFDQPLVGGYFKISETQNFGGTSLEIDFAGGTVPEPSTYILMMTVGTMLAGLILRRRSKRVLIPDASGRN